MNNRVIKFRAWDEKQKVMVYDNDLWLPAQYVHTGKKPQPVKVKQDCLLTWHCCEDTGDYITANIKGSFSTFYSNWDELKTYFDNLTCMQFTGLLDKNGKGDELYEGDLITNISRNGGKPHPIIWSEKYSAWCGDYGTHYLIANELVEINKVGNIYENGDLL